MKACKLNLREMHAHTKKKKYTHAYTHIYTQARTHTHNSATQQHESGCRNEKDNSIYNRNMRFYMVAQRDVKQIANRIGNKRDNNKSVKKVVGK